METNTVDRINLKQKLTLFNEHWTPKIIGEANEQYVKLAKVQGDIIWHAHDNEDEIFLVIEGAITIEMREGKVHLEAGEMFIVPQGVEHRVLADAEAHILLIEPKSTAHTGSTDSEQTVSIEKQEWI
jgi:mannose-6-phosphate isomerase-like protein (cupin superfamily)